MGFNMSWILVGEIDRGELYQALDLSPIDEAPDRHDLGTSRVPLAGAALKSGWFAIFAKYALVLDVTIGTNPPRLTRLPAKSRSITCVVLEHAMVSYASLSQGGRRTWEIRHDASQGAEHLETSGDLPPEFAGFRKSALYKQREQHEHRQPGEWGVDYVFDVPLETAETITGYRHDRAVTGGLFKELRTLIPINGNELTKLSQRPMW